ncbi:MAG: L,D-transpeptidase family protein [Verrucomicrobiaceae bacterium]
MVSKILCLLIIALAPLGALTNQSQQAVVAISSDWNSSSANLFLYEKQKGTWVKIAGPWKTRLGRTGSIWGRGIHPVPVGAATKREGDKKSPAGIFWIGGAWGDAPDIRRHPRLPYRKVTPNDLWVEDSQSPYYNQHLVLEHSPRTPWEKKQQMKQNDYAHSLKLFIAHNAPPKPVPGAGSAVFFHIWRGGGSKPTAGCTTMSEDKLKQLVGWIDPTKKPIYILLPQSEYTAKRAMWKLP